MLPESPCGHELRKRFTQGGAFPGLWRPRAPDQPQVRVVSSILLSQQFQAGEKRLCLIYDSLEIPSLPHHIQFIYPSPSCPFYHPLPYYASNVPDLLLWPWTFKPVDQPRQKSHYINSDPRTSQIGTGQLSASQTCFCPDSMNIWPKTLRSTTHPWHAWS